MIRTISAIAILTFLLPLSVAYADVPIVDYGNLPAYFKALDQSEDPAAVKIVDEIENGPRDLAREIAACRVDGIPVDFSLLKPPTPPDDQNAAIVLDNLDKVKPLIRVPTYADPLNASYDYTPEELERVSTIFSDNAGVVAEIHAAANMPQCQFSDQWMVDPTMNGFKRFAQWRSESRLIASKTVLLANEGEYAKAEANQSDGLKLCRHFLSGPILIDKFTGYAATAMAMLGMDSILKLSPPDAGVADDVGNAVTQNMPDMSLSNGIDGEIAYRLAFAKYCLNLSPTDLAGRFGASTDDAHAKFSALDRTRVNCLIDAQTARLVHLLRDLKAVSGQPAYQRHSAFAHILNLRGVVPEYWIQEVGEESSDPTLYEVNEIGGIIGYDEYLDDECLATEVITFAACSILKAKAQSGSYPDIVPDTYVDPFNGKPLGYRRDGDSGFVVYSVGPTGTFDGGSTETGVRFPNLGFRYPIKKVPVPK